MSLRDVAREFRELPLAAIDRPALDARIDRNPQQLEELASDVARRGVILPLAVVRTGERYEIVDGFCRYIAATRAGLVTVPCMVYPTKDVALEGVKFAANLFRQDMSLADEAKFLFELYTTECNKDIDRLCTLVNKGFNYVSDRLNLVDGDDDVFAALKAKTLTLGVAKLLNTIADKSWRDYYLAHAVKGGATVAVVQGWVSQHRALYETERGPSPPAPVPAAAGVASTYDPHRCVICDKSDPRHIPESLSVHTHCRLAILEPLLEAYRGGSASHE